MATYVDKAYWTQARNELRRQVGTMRYDINNLVELKGSGEADAKTFYKNVLASASPEPLSSTRLLMS